MRIPSQWVNAFLRVVEKPHLGRVSDVARVRRRLERQTRFFMPSPPYTLRLRDRLGGADGVPALWVSAGPVSARGAILYFHGGGYMMGSSATHAAMLARLSSLCGLRAVLPDYRLAPEHSFPAAHEDALGAYRTLLERGYRADSIVLGGDSAGGGLMLALLAAICAGDMPRPGAAFAFSPWTDLTLSGATMRSNARADPFLPVGRARDLRDMYMAGGDESDPRASPLFGRFEGAPPTLIAVSDVEILLDDSRRMVERMREFGTDVRLSLHHRLPHVWPVFQGWMAEADATLHDVAAFVVDRTQPSGPAASGVHSRKAPQIP